MLIAGRSGAEDQLEDHLQSDRLTVVAHREGFPPGDPFDLPFGYPLDRLLLGGKPLAMKGGQKQLSVAHVLVLVKNQD